MTRLILLIGVIAAGTAVVLGAFAAHMLGGRVTPERLQTFEIGVRYQMYHALALLFVGWMSTQWPSWQVSASAYLFMAGITVFSGSLYILVLTDTPWLGAVTPLGGVAFILGWGLLAWAVLNGAG